MKRESLINPRGTDFVPACEGCGHPPHGLFCDTRTEVSNGDMDICLCEAGYGKTEPVSPESGEDLEIRQMQTHEILRDIEALPDYETLSRDSGGRSACDDGYRNVGFDTS
jgi:hypothetical protein